MRKNDALVEDQQNCATATFRQISPKNRFCFGFEIIGARYLETENWPIKNSSWDPTSDSHFHRTQFFFQFNQIFFDQSGDLFFQEYFHLLQAKGRHH